MKLGNQGDTKLSNRVGMVHINSYIDIMSIISADIYQIIQGYQASVPNINLVRRS